jgi:hypothetical protein
MKNIRKKRPAKGSPPVPAAATSPRKKKPVVGRVEAGAPARASQARDAFERLATAFREAWGQAVEDAGCAELLADHVEQFMPEIMGVCRMHKTAPRFVAAGDAFMEAASPDFSGWAGPFSEFCETWLRIGVYQMQDGLLPWPSPHRAMHASIDALVREFGPDWEKACSVDNVFNLRGHVYGEAGGQTWDVLPPGERREVVKQKLLAASRRIARRVAKFAAGIS